MNNKNCNSRHFLSFVFVIFSRISASVANVELPDLNPYCDSISALCLLQNDSNLIKNIKNNIRENSGKSNIGL